MLFNSGEHDVDRISVFGAESVLCDLVKYKDQACDGTLKYRPDMYDQLYILHVLIRNSIPHLFVLLPGKSGDSFSKFFNIVKNLHPTLDPKFLMTDFEKGSIITFSKIYPNTTLAMNLHTF